MLARHTAADSGADPQTDMVRPRLNTKTVLGLFWLRDSRAFDWATWRDQVLPSATRGLGSARRSRACHWPEPSERLHLPAKHS